LLAARRPAAPSHATYCSLTLPIQSRRGHFHPQYQSCMFTVKAEKGDEFVELVQKLKPAS
jgi:hypothetical protein